MPITTENLEQFAQYKNLEHKLVEGMETVLNELSATYTEIADRFGADRAGAFYQALLDTFLPEAGAAGIPEEAIPQEGLVENGELAGTRVTEDGAIIQPETAGRESSGTAAVSDDGESQKLQPRSPQLQEVLSKRNKIGLTGVGKEMGETEERPRYRIPINLSASWHRREDLSTRQLHEFYINPAFSKLLNAQIDSQWLLKPQDTENGKNVTQLYERLRSQTQKLEDALTPFVKEDVR